MSAIDRRIRLLPPLLANQIAAGEVVERPASVVKELLENSIDAGAELIEVEVEEGGVGLIRVKDNGRGIHPEDLPLALSRHATSKIHDTSDLEAITSLGFRGEALASIAAVSRLTLISRRRELEHGWRLEPSFREPVPHPHAPGTTVEVRDLFYNTPARRKFLRSERTEYEHLDGVVRRLALSRFDIGLTLRRNQSTLFSVRRATEEVERERRVVQLLGSQFLAQSMRIEFESAGLRLEGWLGVAGYSRSHADIQHFFLNGRAIRDKLVSHALNLATQGAAEEGRYAAWLLYLTIDPARVDVNVHPTKHEVRFHDARWVHDFLVNAVRQSYARGAEGAGGGEERHPEVPSAPRAAARSPQERSFAPSTYRPVSPPSRSAVKEQYGFYSAALGAGSAGGEQFCRVGESFLLVPAKAGIYLIEIAPAHASLWEGELTEALAAGPLRRQPLLIPAVVPLSGEERGLAEGGGELLHRFGFEVSLLPQQLLVREIPSLFHGCSVEVLIKAVMGALGVEGEQSDSAMVKALAIGMPLPALKGPAEFKSWWERLCASSPLSRPMPWRRYLDLAALEALFATTASR